MRVMRMRGIRDTRAVLLGDIEVRRELNALVRDGVEVHLEPKVMDVLALLMHRADAVVTRQELLDEVWEGRTVGEEALTRCISELRSALGDSHRHPNFIQTVPKRGYRLLQAPRIEGAPPPRPLAYGLAAAGVLVVGIAILWTLSGLGGRTLPDDGPILSEHSDSQPIPTTLAQSTGVPAPDLYFLGRHYWGDREPGSLERAVSLFNEAISLDPDLAQAYSGLADTYLLQASYAGRDPKEAASLAAPLIDIALAINPESADVQASLGILESHNGQTDRAEVALRHAIDLDPTHTMALMWLGNLLQTRGELSAGHEFYERAYRLDPRQAPVVQNYLRSLMMMGDYPAAEKIASDYFVSDYLAGNSSAGNRPAASSPATSPAITMLLAELALEQGNWERVKVLAASMDEEPVSAELLLWRLATVREDLPGGERHLRAAAKLDATDSRVYLAALEHRTHLAEPSEFDRFLDGLAPSAESSEKVDRMAQTWRLLDRVGRGQFEGIGSELQALLDSESSAYPPYSLLLLGYQLVALDATGDEEGYQSARGRGLTLLSDAIGKGWGSYEFHLQSALFLAAAGQLPQATSALEAADEIGDLPVSLLASDPRIGGLLETRSVEKLI